MKSPTAEDYRSETLNLTVSRDDVIAVAILLDSGWDINAPDSQGRRPLHYAQSSRMAGCLLGRGADVNAPDDDGFTPLHLCVDPDTAAILIEAGADINLRSLTGLTPLEMADIMGRGEISALLNKKGARII